MSLIPYPPVSFSRGHSQQKSRSNAKTDPTLKLPGIFRCNSIGQNFQPSSFYLKEQYKCPPKTKNHFHNISLHQLNHHSSHKKQPDSSFQVPTSVQTEEAIQVYKRKASNKEQGYMQPK